MAILWSGPGRALDFHLDLFKRVARTEQFIVSHGGKPITLGQMPDVLKQRCTLMTSTNTGGISAFAADGSSIATQMSRPGDALRQFNMDRATGLVRNEYKILNEGETHYVSHHIASSLCQAAENAPSEPLYETDMPARSGLIVFEYPLLLDDLHPMTGKKVAGLTMPIRAIGWQVTNEVHIRGGDGMPLTEKDGFAPVPGIFYVLYTDTEAFIDLYVSACNQLVPEDAPALEATLDDARLLGAWATDTSAWAFGTSWSPGADERPRDEYEIGQVHSNVAWMRRWLLAYFRWTFQRILIRTEYRPSKHESKRAVRAGHPMDGHMKVLRLRREYEAEQRGEDIDTEEMRWSHQWMVKAHPRRQHYAKMGPAYIDGVWNPDSHRLIWIEPYTKGNPYGPLVLGHSVTAAVR